MHKSSRLAFFGMAVATALLLAGCGGQSEVDEAAHDHPTDPVVTHVESVQPAQFVGLVETPTAEQLNAAKPYPLDTCIVAGEKLGSMGDPVVMVYNNQEIKFCCKSCIDDFKADPTAHMTKLTATN